MSAVVTMMSMLMMRTMAAVKTIHVIVMVGLDIKAVALLVAGIAGIAWHHFYHCRRLSYSSRPDSDRPTLQKSKVANLSRQTFNPQLLRTRNLLVATARVPGRHDVAFKCLNSS